MSRQTINIPSLTSEEERRILAAADRVKKEAMRTGQFQYVHLAFVNGEMQYSESHQMVIINKRG